MTLIDADKFLAYLIFSKHIDELTCGEVKEAIEMCKVDVFDKIISEIRQKQWYLGVDSVNQVIDIINKHIGENK